MVEASIPQSKGKKKLILGITLSLLLIAGVCLAVMRPRVDGTETYYQESPDKKTINAQPEPAIERASMTTFYSNAVEEAHSRIGCNVSDKRKLDWVVFTHPLTTWDKASRPQSDLIKNISLTGDASASEKAVGNLIFSRTKKLKPRPNLFAKSSASGDGWQIEVLNKDSKYALGLKLHFTTWNCDARLRILSDDGSTEIVPAILYTSDSENTSFGTNHMLTTEQLKGHKSFILELTTAKAKSKKLTGISINALIVE